MKKILISAGHSNAAGQDRGAAGNGFVEGIEATKLRDLTADYLKAFPVNVLEDGGDGANDPLRKALELARAADVAIEYHFNSGPSKATGIEVLAKPKNESLARKIAGAIHAATGLPLRGKSGYKADDSGQHHRLAFCEAGGLIVEVCFISNPEDMRAYKENFDEICRGVATVLGELAPAQNAGKTVDKKEPQTSPQFIPAVRNYNLKKGDSGGAVRALQTALKIHGFLLEKEIDGIFGKNTEESVMAFQAQKNLRPDGIVGNLTAGALGLPEKK